MLTLDDLTESTQGCCFYCGRLIAAQFSARPKADWILVGKGQHAVIEHTKPRYRGGTDCPSNLVPSCSRCNSQKGTKTLDEFELWLGITKRDLSFRFWMHMPAPNRDWLHLYSKDFEKQLLWQNPS